MSRVQILLVDDDPQSLESTKRILEHADYEVTCAASGIEALEKLKIKKPDLIVTDVRMPGMSGMEFIAAFQKIGLQIPFIVMTAFGQVQDAVWAMKMGAVDFLLKPFKRQALCDAVEQVEKRLHRGLTSTQNTLIGSSRLMQELKMLIEQVGKTDASVLIIGESGTGKEQVAKLVHERSIRNQGPFVAVNCAAIPDNLLESELFGYEKGAFSGANQSRAGLIESANGGTLLLDEIGDMPLALQPKLLRVLEEQKVRRLGSNLEKSIQVRILAATHQNLLQKVKTGQFRQDLFYRLDVMTLAVPALRDRSEDIPELTQYFLSKFAQEYEKKINGIDTEAQASLLTHAWPGNVRELSNVLERAVVLNENGLVQKKDLPLHFQGAAAESAALNDRHQSITIPLGMSLKDIEDLMIQKALAVSHGDRGQAAKLLGVNERTIYRRISKTKED
jgi:DNA-binding NtrC family response regulator